VELCFDQHVSILGMRRIATEFKDGAYLYRGWGVSAAKWNAVEVLLVQEMLSVAGYRGIGPKATDREDASTSGRS